MLHMNWFNTVIILGIAYLAVYLQATFNTIRNVVGAQVDLLPSLMVYTGLSGGLASLTLAAIGAGLWFDSLSANPLGVSILPLFLVGYTVHRTRELILRDQAYAQMLLGLAASAAAPFLTVLLLLNIGRRPLVGWFSLWQWFVISVVGAAFTPLWFWFFGSIGGALNYRPFGVAAFRPDREIKRGRQ
jgi:cell shape-determining protein MreD